VLVLVSAPVEGHAAQNAGQQISRKEAKQLMRHASSPDDYQKLTAYFEQRSQSLEAKAEKYQKEADRYASSPVRQPTKGSYPGGWPALSRFLASEYRLKAQKERAKADRYRAMSGGHSEIVHLAQA